MLQNVAISGRASNAHTRHKGVFLASVELAREFMTRSNRMAPRARRQTQTGTPTPQQPVESMVTGSPAGPPESRLTRIAQRAYCIYERRGGQNGSSVDDWLQAEREIDNED